MSETVETTTQNSTITIPSQLWSDPVGYIQQHQEVIISVCMDLVFAILILVLGWLLAKFIAFLSLTIMSKAKVETTISRFISNIFKYFILAFAVAAALEKVGVQTASFVAIIGAASFAVAMSLQGSLSNFAAGVLMLIFRPIKIGELVEVSGKQGVVEEITIFTTTLVTVDNKMIIIPNSSVSSGNITNFSRMEFRRVDFVFGVEYGSDLKKVKETLVKIFNEDPRVIKDKGITVVVGALNTSSIDFTCRVWVKNADYWNTFFECNEKVYNAFNAANIGIPFQTVTVVNAK